MVFQIESLTPLIQVFNIRRSLAFYREVMGFEVVCDSGDGDDSSWVWIRRNGFDLMLNDQYEPGSEPDSPPSERVRWHEDTCLYLGCRELDAAHEHLQSNGVPAEPPITAPYGMRQLYFKDPDNYSICLQWPAEK
jgi:glyoxylase I family protein